MSRTSSTEAIATLRIDIGKNVFHLIGLNRGPPFFCAKSDLWPPLVAPYRPAALLNRSQARRRSASSGTTAQKEWPPIPATYVRPYAKGQRTSRHFHGLMACTALLPEMVRA